MARPQIMKITPFDANYDHEITISWLGNRAYANRIIIYDNETNDVMFDEKIPSFQLKHTIPGHVLTNGKSWVIQAQVYDEEDTPSTLSDKVLFYTFTTPSFYFDNIPDGGKIKNASFIASLYYFSPEYENISSYNFYLYDSSKKQLFESGVFNEDLNISYTYRGLDNNTVYYIRCVGVTVNGMPLDTGYIEINVYYEDPSTYSRIYTTSITSQGCVQVASNIIVIDYTGDEHFDYVDGMIDLRDKVLYYDEGFNIENDFTLLLKGKYLWQTNEILRMCNKGDTNTVLSLSSHIYTDNTLRFRLIAPNGVCNYLLYSDSLQFTDEDIVTIAIRRINNIYLIKVFMENEDTDEIIEALESGGE